MIDNNWFNNNFFLIAGPCVVESRGLLQDVAGQVKTWCSELNIPYIFKASFEKANRSRLDSFTGIGDEVALEAMASVKKEFGVPLTTDVHKDEHIDMVAEIIDVIQIPAFLCRQTSLLVAAAHSGRIVNVKERAIHEPGINESYSGEDQGIWKRPGLVDRTWFHLWLSGSGC